MAEAGSISTPKEVLKYAKDNEVQIVDFRFTDLPGLTQHFSVPIKQLTEDGFEEGYGFDGSSIRGFQADPRVGHAPDAGPEDRVHRSVLQHTTLLINCFVADPVTGELHARPRYIARKAEDHLKATGIADISYWGPEAEFYIFDGARFDQNQHSGYYFIDSVRRRRGHPDTRKPRLSPRYKEGYFPVPPMDQHQDLRSEMVLTHHGVRHPDRGPAPRSGHRRPGRDGHALRVPARDGGQRHELQVRRQERRLASGQDGDLHAQAGLRDNGSGMHVHQSLWKNGKNLFYDEAGTRGCQDMARYYIGGLLAHAPALLAFARRPPTATAGWCRATRRRSTSSTRSATARRASASPCTRKRQGEAHRVPAAGPVVQPVPRRSPRCCRRGWTGSGTRSSRPSRSTRTSTTSSRRRGEGAAGPGSLEEVLDALEADHEFLLEGGVFTEDVIETWLDYKRRRSWTRSACVRTRTSSASTTTSDALRIPMAGTLRPRNHGAPWFTSFVVSTCDALFPWRAQKNSRGQPVSLTATERSLTTAGAMCLYMRVVLTRNRFFVCSRRFDAAT